MDEVFNLIKQEEKRQEETLTLIPSENYASYAVRDAVGSILTNKYSEGYPGKRYYQGNKIIDEIENLAIDRAKKLFSVPHANVQPYSGSPANSEVMIALLTPGDTIMGMSLASGGHLTHGHPDITFSGKFFRSVQFGLNKKDEIDFVKLRQLALKEKPKVLIIGTTAYPLILDWEKFSEIADEVDAYLVTDISHVAGLIMGGAYPSPVKYAHIITTTTHKTLRGPRGAMIMVTDKGLNKDPDLVKKIDRAVFPGMQGGPHENTIAGIAVCLNEAIKTEFKIYAKQVVHNAYVLATELKNKGLTLVGGGTESHLILVDLRPQNLSGNIVAEALEISGIVVNKNSIPNDTAPAFYPSGIRLGTPAVTTRGMKEKEMKQIADWIFEVINYVKEFRLPKNTKSRSNFIKTFKQKIEKDKFLLAISKDVKTLCKRFPIPN
ncbi:serine hydroxymethyltransferase [Candidatus Woesebacteria bacterium RBG_16_34_12]|uniref:Serine hydroxymethyltransferase n=1 Tax=Candidatus Woesebacteria bacterium RBG_16_34_12 TaxID=1802480 RepID=A0A1F7X9G2_9BACT|nr:MAG: serine hydroxymethyltransferase [Candidatus Woesebacteria bacterium RBG_16_34_12]